METIILVEDEVVIREEIKSLLESYNYQVKVLTDFENILTEVLALEGDLLLLDLNLPKFDGFYWMKEIRKNSNMPIMILTSSQKEMDELLGLQLGADDYIQKPFHAQILLARIQAVLARTNHQKNERKLLGPNFEYQVERHEVSCESGTWSLSGNEHLILSLLLEHRGKVVQRETLMNHLWQHCSFVDDNTLTVNVNRLRKHLKEMGIEDCIQTKRGEGYIIL